MTNNWIAGLVSIVVAGIILLIMFKLGTEAQQRSISATQQRALRVSNVGLLGFIEHDFQNIGSNYPDFDLIPGDAIFELDTVGTDQSFAYVGQTKLNTVPDTVRYTWSVIGQKTIDRGTVDVYRLRRWINGQLTGESSGVVTDFGIGLLTSDGTPAAAFSDTRQILIRLSMVSSIGESSLLRETEWRSIVRPTALARLDYEDYL